MHGQQNIKKWKSVSKWTPLEVGYDQIWWAWSTEIMLSLHMSVPVGLSMILTQGLHVYNEVLTSPSCLERCNPGWGKLSYSGHSKYCCDRISFLNVQRKVFTMMYLQQIDNAVFEFKAKKTSHWYSYNMALTQRQNIVLIIIHNASRQKWFSSQQLHSTSKIPIKQNNPRIMRLQTFPMSWKSIYLLLANLKLQNENTLSCNLHHEIYVPKPRGNR